MKKKITITKWEAAQIISLLMESGYVLHTQEKSGQLKNNEFWNYNSKKIKKEYNLRMKSMLNKILPPEEKLGRKSHISPFSS